MNTVKFLSTLTVILIFTVLTGCSDSTFSPVSSGQISSGNTAEDNKPSQPKEISIKLQPFETQSFDYENTGFYTFTSFAVENCHESESSITAFGYSDDVVIELGCYTENYRFQSISIENHSKDIVKLTFVVTGTLEKSGRVNRRDLEF